MKIAVLISGEYRTFDACAPTMKFLHDPRVDIYFSTWDATRVELPLINFKFEESVTVERITKAIQKPATIVVDPLIQALARMRYNSKMIFRWKRGFNLIKESKIDYDYVLMVRPDLYYHPISTLNLDWITNIASDGTLASAWYKPGWLNDTVTCARYEVFSNLMRDLTVFEWSKAKNMDWHTWFYEFSSTRTSNIAKYDCSFFFCRPLKPQPANYEDMLQVADDWRDITIISQTQSQGRDKVAKHWPEEIITNAEKRWSDGDFDKYKK